MEEITLYLLIFSISLIIIFLTYWLETRNLPPGPWGLPILGSAPFLGGKPFEAFLKLSFKYGAVISVQLGRRNVVVLNDYKSVIEAFVKKGDVFNHRGEGTLMRVALQGKGIVDAEGPLWKEHRRYTLRVLRDFGFGKKTIEEVILSETQELITKILTYDQKPFILHHDLCCTIVNIVWSIVADYRFKWNDPKLEEFLDLMGANTKHTGQAGILARVPWLRFVLPGGNSRIKKAQEKRKKFFQDVLDKHKATKDSDKSNDLINEYLKESQRQIEIYGRTTFTEDQTRTVMSDLFVAGMETVVATLRWAFLLLMKYPYVQKKIQEEIDEVVGRERKPTYEDKKKMPFTEATIFEIQRYGSVIPFVLHANPVKTELYGYDIPERTWVFGNLWAVHHNPNTWHEPQVFNPYRFYDEVNHVVKKNDAFMPFSVGRRSCLGESLAKMELFLVLTTILQKFILVRPENQSLDLGVNIGITQAPEEYYMSVSLRN